MSLRVVLVRPQQPGNIGAAARALANHGMHELVLVDPPGFDPERARWMAPGARDIIDNARIVASVEIAVADAVVVIGTTGRVRRWSWPVLSPSQLAAQLDSRPTAVLFGQEEAGLSNADLARCHAVVRIPTAAHRSLNLGQAVNVLCATLRSTTHAPAPAPALADSSAQAAVVAQLLRVLDASDYLRGRSPEQVHGTLYRLLARAQPTQQEATAMLGMLNKMCRQLRITSES